MKQIYCLTLLRNYTAKTELMILPVMTEWFFIFAVQYGGQYSHVWLLST